MRVWRGRSSRLDFYFQFWIRNHRGPRGQARRLASRENSRSRFRASSPSDFPEVCGDLITLVLAKFQFFVQVRVECADECAADGGLL